MTIQHLRQLHYQPGARLLAARNAIAILRTKRHTYVADNLDEFVNDALAMRNALPYLLDIAEAASNPQLGKWTREGEQATRTLCEALHRLEQS